MFLFITLCTSPCYEASEEKEERKFQCTNILCNVQSEKVPSSISVTTNYYQLPSPPSRKLIQYGVAQNEIIIH
jgi:hypothetical protein